MFAWRVLAVDSGNVNQSSVIFGFLLVAWLVFITQRGELPVYWGFLAKSPQGASSGPNASGSGVLGVAQTLGSITNTAAQLGAG